MDVTIYTKSACPQCDMTKRAVERYEIPVDQWIDLEADPQALEYVQARGYASAPIVIVRDPETGEIAQEWSGFRPDRLSNLAQQMQMADEADAPSLGLALATQSASNPSTSSVGLGGV